MAGPQLGAMCAAPAEAAGLGQELHGEGSSFRQVSACLQRAEASAAAPAGSGETGWPRGPLRAPPNPSPCQASLARARTERRKGRRKAAGAGAGSAASISAPSGAGLRGRGGTGQRRVRGARTGEDGGEDKEPSAQSAALCPQPGSCPPEPFRFTSAALPAHLGWFLSEGGFAVFPPRSVRAKGTRRKGI